MTAVITTPAESALRRGNGIEIAVATVILASLVLGVFFPPEAYFAEQNFSVQAQTSESGGRFPFGRIGYALTLGWLAVVCTVHRATMIRAFLRGWIVIAFSLLTLASAAWAPDLATSLNRSLRMVIIVIFALYFIQCFDDDTRILILARAMAIAILASIFAVVAMPKYGLSALQGYTDALRGAFVHKNTLGATMAAGVYVGYFALTSRSVSRRLALFVMLGSLLLVIGSRSATSILATIMTLPILYWVSWTRSLRTGNDRLLAILAGAVLIGLCGWLIMDDTLIFELLGRSSTLTGRTEVWNLSIWAAQVNPWFGQGHTFWGVPNPLRDEIWRMIGWAPPHAHHTLIDIWLQLGYVGVALLLVIVTIITLRGAGLLLSGLPAPAMLWLVLFLQLVIRSQTETTIIDTAISGMFWLTAIYAAFAQLGQAQSRRATPL